jgi:hypothetical protein
MSKIICFRLVFITIPLLLNSAQGQPDHFAYAITAINKVGSEWVAFRKLDTRTGVFSNILLNVQDNSPNSIDFFPYKALGNNEVSNPVIDVSRNKSSPPVISNSVAAIAYDRKSNRLYYTPMNIDQLRYVDLSTMQIFSDLDQFFSKTGKYDSKNTGPINRMVIAPDGFGYTITNDGNHMFRFTTNGTPVLTDLGELMDDPLNQEMTIHNPCANSGGDLIADDAGHLFLICGSNRVFKVDINTRMTSYLATISGLPLKFSTSGAAVTDDGKLIISSAVYSDAIFIVDPESWYVSSSTTIQEIYGSADLANSNILHTKTSDYSNLFLKNPSEIDSKIKVFPNPVLFDEISVQFNELPAGNYSIQLANVLGKKLIQQKVNISGITQTEVIHIPSFAAQGFYYVHILDESNNVVSTQKLIVERW